MPRASIFWVFGMNNHSSQKWPRPILGRSRVSTTIRTPSWEYWAAATGPSGRGQARPHGDGVANPGGGTSWSSSRGGRVTPGGAGQQGMADRGVGQLAPAFVAAVKVVGHLGYLSVGELTAQQRNQVRVAGHHSAAFSLQVASVARMISPSLRIPRDTRALTVPTGTSSRSAISRWLRSSK